MPSDSIVYPRAIAAAPAPTAPVMLTSTPAPVTAVAAPASANQYKVKPGDTLYGIARTAYGDGKHWSKIASANPGLSAKSLKVGQTITLP
jgi:5'-nucleotidase